MMPRDFSFFIDRGGTFTDVVALLPSQQYKTLKLLSVDPSNYEDAPREGIRRVLEAELGSSYPRDKPLDTSRIKSIRMGTTVATNALLERKGERTCLITTKGFRDLWKIGNQSRPKIFELDIKKWMPGVLYEEVVEVDERVTLPSSVDANGREVRLDTSRESKFAHMTNMKKGVTGESVFVEKEPDLDIIREYLQNVFNKGIRSVAICLMHSPIYAEHEVIIGQICRDLGFVQISLSHEVMKAVKIVPRGYTTTADAYLTPHIAQYTAQFVKGFDQNLLRDVDVSFMQSDGGLAGISDFSGHRAILSGPAGGVVGLAHTSFLEPSILAQEYVKTKKTRVRTIKAVIGFDMGGTSTDVSRFSGTFDHVFETTTAGVTIQAPQLDISTVAAGGGSKLLFANQMLIVGPDSVGAHPGPVCYRKTKFSVENSNSNVPIGNLAVTDANLFLGRLIPDLFPKIFGETEDQPLDVEATCNAFYKITSQVNEHADVIKSPEEVAMGFIDVANEAMCRPIRAITQMKGFNLKTHTLACFGGAGGQHACGIAKKLGISTIFVHRFSGVLSALGIGMADVTEERQVPSSLLLANPSKGSNGFSLQQSAVISLKLTFEQLQSEALEKLQSSSQIAETNFKTLYFLNLRYDGTDCNFMTELDSSVATEDTVHSFITRHQREFGFTLPERNIVVDAVRVRCLEKNSHRLASVSSAFYHPDACSEVKNIQPISHHRVFFNNSWIENTPIYEMSKICSELCSDRIGNPHARFNILGPAIISADQATLVVEPNWDAEVTVDGDVFLSLIENCSNGLKLEQKYEVADPIELSIYSHRFMSIAEQMGKTLQRTSVSVNIKERLDFSCALFSATGELIANAPHIPVHLGAMQEAVKCQMQFWDPVCSPGANPITHEMVQKIIAENNFGLGINEGDVFVSNHPQLGGGSHLPDITVITPVFYKGKIVFWVANRGHHADVGGISPGSMPPDSVTLAEEGIAILTFKIVDNGVFQEEKLKKLLSTPPVAIDTKRPSLATRILADNISDLRAQVAANTNGIELVKQLIEEESLEKVQAYMGFILHSSENAVREVLKSYAKAKAGTASTQLVVFESEDFMDDATRIKLKVTITVNDGSAVFDFSGTGPQVFANTNAPPAVTFSAIIYCLRCMLSLDPESGFSDIPLNQGCLNPVKIIIPDKSILAPSSEAAVVGGNVLTSQRVVDVIFKAFTCVAASQGCTNNVTFGDEKFGYYETVAGGAGAGEGFDGQSGVHTHMTNTRITDPEILEKRYPVVLRKFMLRSGSAGDGRFKGGEGVIREMEFRRPLQLSLLTERRTERFKPYGLFGGADGSNGINLVNRRGSKTWENVGGKASIAMNIGDSVRIMTPGGGGFGSVPSSKL